MKGISNTKFYLVIFLVVALGMGLSMAIAFIVSKNWLNPQYMMVVGGAAAFVLVFLKYLQSGSSDTESSRMAEVRAEIAALSDKIDEIGSVDGNEYELSRLVESALDQEVVKEKIVRNIELATENREREAIVNILSNLSGDIVFRLEREISDMRLRSNFNLVFGVLMAIFGVFFLWTSISTIDPLRIISEGYSSSASSAVGEGALGAKEAFFSLIPRLSLVLFVEFFAYFFLRLYRSSLWEIKYIQNEITNIEAKMIPVHVAWIRDDAGALVDALKSLSKTERNFVLEKDQTTVELEKARASNAVAQQVVKAVPDLLQRVSK